MSEVTSLLDELNRIHDGDGAWHGLSLNRILHDITADQALRCLPGASHSICGLVLHIGAWEDVFWDRLEGRDRKEPEEGDFPPVPGNDEQTWKDALALLERAHQRLLSVVAAMKDADLSKPIPGKDYNAGFMLHGVVRHHVYHAGQIGLLKTLVQAR
jgi:uncharacterized damage-inducible protein DinB